jgi:DNA-binding MarR family transcriptional regulator
VSDEARRIDLTAQIIELEPQMLRVLGPAQARDWVDVELTMSQLKMRFVLSSAMGPGDGTSGLRVGEVARGLGVTLPTVTAVMDKLVERGLVRRDEDPLDRRQHVCRLTTDGQSLLHRLMAGRRAFTHALLEHMDEDELAAFLRGMEVLLAAAKRLRASASADAATDGDAGAPSREIAASSPDRPATSQRAS